MHPSDHSGSTAVKITGNISVFLHIKIAIIIFKNQECVLFRNKIMSLLIRKILYLIILGAVMVFWLYKILTVNNTSISATFQGIQEKYTYK